jgi:hypothetical protein
MSDKRSKHRPCDGSGRLQDSRLPMLSSIMQNQELLDPYRYRLVFASNGVITLDGDALTLARFGGAVRVP